MLPTVAALAGVLIGAALVLLVQRASARPPGALGAPPVQPAARPSSPRSARARFSPVGLSDIEQAELEQENGTPDEQDEPAERRPYDEDDEPPEEPGR